MPFFIKFEEFYLSLKSPHLHMNLKVNLVYKNTHVHYNHLRTGKRVLVESNKKIETLHLALTNFVIYLVSIVKLDF